MKHFALILFSAFICFFANADLDVKALEKDNLRIAMQKKKIVLKSVEFSVFKDLLTKKFKSETGADVEIGYDSTFIVKTKPTTAEKILAHLKELEKKNEISGLRKISNTNFEFYFGYKSELAATWNHYLQTLEPPVFVDHIVTTDGSPPQPPPSASFTVHFTDGSIGGDLNRLVQIPEDPDSNQDLEISQALDLNVKISDVSFSLLNPQISFSVETQDKDLVNLQLKKLKKTNVLKDFSAPESNSNSAFFHLIPKPGTKLHQIAKKAQDLAAIHEKNSNIKEAVRIKLQIASQVLIDGIHPAVTNQGIIDYKSGKYTIICDMRDKETMKKYLLGLKARKEIDYMN